jgi:hypothetical protein
LRTGTEADELFRQAGEKYEQAARIKSNDHEALNHWGQILMSRFELAPNDKQQEFYNQSKETLLKAEAVKPGSGAYNLACLHALNNEVDECQKWLLICKSTGTLPDWKKLEEDPDLNVIKDQQWFKDLIKDLP